MSWSKTEILSATGGKIVRDNRKVRFGEIVTDSTKVRPGAVFVALKGERHDGHRFVGIAVRRGAACVIVQRALSAKEMGQATTVQVADTLRALGDLAHHRRQKIGLKVLAITGSNGKTTTKEMIAAILEEANLGGQPLRGRVLKTQGNFNNLVGLPLTLLGLRRHHRIAVVELGTNHPGEIQRLAEIAEPDMGIITSVGAAHLEGLKSLAGVAREKGSLYRNIRRGGAIAVNLDDPWTSRLGARFKGPKFTYGKRGQVRAVSTQISRRGGVDVVLQAGRRRCKVRLNYLGQHNIANALGAAALTLGTGVSLTAVRRGLEKVRPFSMRMQIEEWHGIGVINDTYNANPASMKAALTTLADIPSKGAKIAVLGDMFELGKHSAREHRQLGRAAADAALSGLYLLGAHAENVRRGAIAGAMDADTIIIGENHLELARQLGDRVKRGDWLLFKGSRGMAMEKVLHELQRRRA